jgi:uncharacterized protein YcbK (DUF882 family)
MEMLPCQSHQSVLASLVETPVERRRFLKVGLAGFLAASVPLISSRNAQAAPTYGQWKIAMHHSHTGETFSGVYRVGDQYLPEAFERINYLLRDFRSDEAFPMDPHVIDILSVVQARTRTGRPMEVLSGYRCPKTNAMLRHETRGVAKKSLHMFGQAIDFRMPGFNTGRLRNLAQNLKAGGVGYYPRSNFVHVDTGALRHW